MCRHAVSPGAYLCLSRSDGELALRALCQQHTGHPLSEPGLGRTGGVCLHESLNPSERAHKRTVIRCSIHAVSDAVEPPVVLRESSAAAANQRTASNVPATGDHSWRRHSHTVIG